MCGYADGSMPSVRVCTQRMRWNRLLMRALLAHLAPHMFQNLWVSLRLTVSRSSEIQLRYCGVSFLTGCFIGDTIFFFSLLFALWSQ